MLPVKSPASYCLIAVALILGLWAGSYLVLRTALGEVVNHDKSVVCASWHVPGPGHVPNIVQYRMIFLHCGDKAEHAARVAEVMYWPFLQLDKAIYGIEIYFIPDPF